MPATAWPRLAIHARHSATPKETEISHTNSGGTKRGDLTKRISPSHAKCIILCLSSPPIGQKPNLNSILWDHLSCASTVWQKRSCIAAASLPQTHRREQGSNLTGNLLEVGLLAIYIVILDTDFFIPPKAQNLCFMLTNYDRGHSTLSVALI